MSAQLWLGHLRSRECERNSRQSCVVIWDRRERETIHSHLCDPSPILLLKNSLHLTHSQP